MIGFAKILGGMPSSTSGMTEHLMNRTLALGLEEMVLAAYYGRGQVRRWGDGRACPAESPMAP